MAKRSSARSDDPSYDPANDPAPAGEISPANVPPAMRKVPVEELPPDTPRRADGNEKIEEKDAWARAHQYDTPAPGQPGASPAPEGTWQPPDGDQEFVYDGTPGSIPEWADKGWTGYDNGPVLQVPMVDFAAKGVLPRSQPYHTSPARAGDTIKWVEKRRHFEIVAGDGDDEGTHVAA